ncbi:MAG TPA: type II secretion system protein N [Candidatus Omnitrophota bacterium]|nr:type II secretion system protein N [Candidatus Omnitrophota bacterium]
MTDSTKIILIVGAILIATAYVLLYTPLADVLFVPKPKIPQPIRPVPPPPHPFILPTAEAAASSITSEAEKAAPKLIPSGESSSVPKFMVLRDPFAVNFSFAKAAISTTAPSGAPAEKPVPKKVLQLQGVFLSGGTKSAIIDDRVVSVGSIVAGGYRVSDIRDDRVLLKKDGKHKVLKIK